MLCEKFIHAKNIYRLNDVLKRDILISLDLPHSLSHIVALV